MMYLYIYYISLCTCVYKNIYIHMYITIIEKEAINLLVEGTGGV